MNRLATLLPSGARRRRASNGWHRRLGAPLAALVAVALAGGGACAAVGPEEEARTVPLEQIPTELVNPAVTLDEPGAGTQAPAELYLFNPASTTTPAIEATPDSLAVCDAPTGGAGESVEVRVTAVVERLIAMDPSTSESCARDLVNAVPPELTVLGVRNDPDAKGVIELDLSKDALSGVEAAQQRRAIAQMVFTVTAVGGVEGVRFLADGEPISVPIEGDTADSGAVVSRADFPALLAGVVFGGATSPPTTEVPPVP